ncbi:MAG: HlyC/CorC family transporter [Flavobacteriales bacterium]|nr:HlyC/CorC family transporter [Flavobacteriales bacterium]
MFEFFIIALSIILSAFFSGTEIAFVSTGRMQIELERKKKNYFSKLFIFLCDRPKRFITSLLIGNTVALVVYSYYTGKILTQWITALIDINQFALLLIQTFISTFIILVTAEYLPKALFSTNPYRYFKFFTAPAYFFYIILSPLVFIVNGFSEFILKLLKKGHEEEENLEFKEEMSYFISQKMEEADEEKVDSEVQIFKNALHFSDVRARDCMIPRKEIIGFELNDSINSVKQKFIDAGFSKILIYKENIDNIIGYVHAFDMFKKPKYIKNVLMPVEFVHETASVKNIMNVLIKKRRSIAIVIDEYGGTAGMVTLEDIVEELFGEIEDEHDKPQLTEQKITKNEYLFSARLEIDYINQEYGLKIETSDNYETLGGFIVSHLEDIPQIGENFILNNIKFSIEKVSNTKIEEVRITIQNN